MGADEIHLHDYSVDIKAERYHESHPVMLPQCRPVFTGMNINVESVFIS